MNGSVKSILLVFNQKLKRENIRNWREQANAMVLEKRDDKFFNHYLKGPHKGKPISRYSLIQYRCYNGKAAIYGVMDGRQSLLEALATGYFKTKAKAIDVDTFEDEVYMTEDYLFKYYINNLHIFGDSAYELFKQIKEAKLAFEFIEQKITEQIIKLLSKDLEILDNDSHEYVQVRISENYIEKVSDYFLNLKKYKGNNPQKWHTLDLEILSNVHLPQMISIGNNVAFGNGVMYRQ